MSFYKWDIHSHILVCSINLMFNLLDQLEIVQVD